MSQEDIRVSFEAREGHFRVEADCSAEDGHLLAQVLGGIVAQLGGADAAKEPRLDPEPRNREDGLCDLPDKLNEEELDQLFVILKERIETHNADGHLRSFLETLNEAIGPDENIAINPQGKILVIGGSRARIDHLLGIARELGVDKDRFVFELDYNLKTYPFEKLRYNSDYAAVMVGPMPHSTSGKGDFNCTLSALRLRDGFPPIIALSSQSGELKITKAGFRNALADALERGLVVA